ncbi:Fbox domain and Ankyrin repeat containing protein [Acanthamoeba castellanii str. Neff]|uniref:Fbox domain and Ankyrin repeat containing protein n=1 Tax=Acanthamoeba castellanii (strain ATCC 30010 / Neff) TaxID=1257118 RepID=L8GTH9_ACACF|nr:Fbox domain and Ankyrin repeat containing protein [Acanthamoeba castellanii str. Neff]ELR16222.1 Fbox domain and Ankyrin repeat containing protein [Acanthamoeba castellanii str. Neff]
MGLRPLLAAVKCNNMVMAGLLIDHGAQVHQQNCKRSELHSLAETQQGPYPDLPATVGARWVNTVQRWVMPSPAVKFWQLLLGIGASPNWPDRHGMTPFHVACARGNWPVVQFLLQGKHVSDVDKADEQGETALHYAARYGHAAVVSLLLSDTRLISKHGNAAETKADGSLITAGQAARAAGHVAVAELIESWSYRACPLLFMPFDALVHLMALLEPHDLCSVAQTCSTLNEVSSDDHVWRRFCSPRWSSDDKGCEGKQWKARYMAWLQPRLKQYATSKARGFTGAAASARPSTHQSEDYDHLFKFNLIGDSGAGKTYLHTRFLPKFHRHHSSTIGVEFGSRTIEMCGQRIKLQVWDTAGQERFRSITGAYYRGSRGLLVVYDITARSSWKNAKYWVEEVRRSLADDVDMMPFILVGTKNDLEHQRQVSPEEGQALALELGAAGWAETSSRTGSEVENTFLRLTEAALLGVDPFSSSGAGPECCVPSAEVLQALYDKSITGRAEKERIAALARSSQCLLQ